MAGKGADDFSCNPKALPCRLYCACLTLNLGLADRLNHNAAEPGFLRPALPTLHIANRLAILALKPIVRAFLLGSDSPRKVYVAIADLFSSCGDRGRVIQARSAHVTGVPGKGVDGIIANGAVLKWHNIFQDPMSIPIMVSLENQPY